MIAHGKDIKIFSGTSNRPLAEAICKEVGTELGNAEVGAFSDGENFVSIYETVRGSDVFVVQSTSSPVNDNLMALLIMIDQAPRPHLRQAGGQPDHPRRRRPGPHHGSPRQPDSGLL